MRSVFISSLLALIFAAAGALPARVSAQTDDDVIESFAIDGNGGPLLIPVAVDGKEYTFLLDTGATVNTFDTRLKGALKRTGKMRPFNSGTLVELCECQNTTIGVSKLPPGKWAIGMSVDHLASALRVQISGILGTQFLRDKIVQLDFDAGRALILKPGTRVGGQKIPMGFTSAATPTVDVELPIIGTTTFLIDTGCTGFSSGFLNTQVFDDLSRGRALRRLERLYITFVADGRRNERIGMLDWQSLDGLRHTSQFYNEGASKNDRNGLGLGYLARYKVTLDFIDRYLFCTFGH